MAGTLTVTVNKNPFLSGELAFTIILDWVSTAGGAVSAAIASTYTTQLALLSANPIACTKIQGAFRSIQTIPGTKGDLATNLPTASYSLTLLDKYSYDILNGSCAALSGTASEKQVAGGGKVIIDSELTLTIASAGDTKQGRVILEFEDLSSAHIS